ncbi:MAG: hypothetical protein EXX96DRAFT_580802 [Benjaminiella poitrasii]|nr:MAG: hypothetical protein EXX96DRAFT_580802 [Benjaminiella poitrasii]
MNIANTIPLYQHTYNVLTLTFYPSLQTGVFYISMALPARNLWYCVLYELGTHFLFECLKERIIWAPAFGYIYPYIIFTKEQIFSSLLRLYIPSTMPKPQHTLYFSLVAVIQYSFWKLYWQCIFHGIPFLPNINLRNI